MMTHEVSGRKKSTRMGTGEDNAVVLSFAV